MQSRDGKKPRQLPSKMQLTVWLLVGGYLLYTVWSVKDTLFTHTGGERYLMIGFLVLFLAAGTFLVLKGAHGLLTGRYIGGMRDTETEEVEEAAETQEGQESEDP